jgi:hypothetical protein
MVVPLMVKTEVKQTRDLEQSKIPVLTGLLDKIEIWCVTGFGILGVFMLILVGSRNRISELL